MGPNKQKVIKVLVFAFLFGLIFNEISTIVQRKWPDRTAAEIRFQSEPQNTIDVLFVGSSSYYRGISPLVLWNKYGFTSYVLASNHQSPLALYTSVEDGLKNQKIKLVVLDGKLIFKNYDYFRYEGDVRRYLDPKPFSMRKIGLFFAFWNEEHKLSLTNMLFPLIRYHSRWSELSESDYQVFDLNSELDTKGQTNIYKYIPMKYPEDYMEKTNEQLSLDEDSKQIYDQILNLCKRNNVEVIFMTLPRMNWNQASSNALKSYSDSKQVPYIDFSFPVDITRAGLDLNFDFSDRNHLNNIGAQKISIIVGEKLLQMVDLPDHHDDLSYSKWNSTYKAYKEAALDPSKLTMDIEKMKMIEELNGDDYFQLE